jgi:malonyl-CoA O-methyltransferase
MGDQSVADARAAQGFARQASSYDRHAQLQRAVAWRLARHCLSLALPPGPMADLGAGSGLLGRALEQQGFRGSLQQLDGCRALLAHNPLAASHGQLIWNLDQGLPGNLNGCGLLTSSFALQWLQDPPGQLELWCRSLAPGGWLALAVPTAGSFPQWEQAATGAAVPHSRWPLPDAAVLEAAAARHLQLERRDQLRFSRSYGSGLGFLRHLQQLGAGLVSGTPLATGQLRRLLRQWPDQGVVTWNVLILVGQRP